MDLTTKHRYSFDITAAVQAWFDGTHDLDKGIIFKTDTAVENGTTSNYCTFGSYNRSSNKSSLVVVYQLVSDSITSAIGKNYVVEGHGRNRNLIFVPQESDVQNVIFIYFLENGG